MGNLRHITSCDISGGLHSLCPRGEERRIALQFFVRDPFRVPTAPLTPSLTEGPKQSTRSGRAPTARLFSTYIVWQIFDSRTILGLPNVTQRNPGSARDPCCRGSQFELPTKTYPISQLSPGPVFATCVQLLAWTVLAGEGVHIPMCHHRPPGWQDQRLSSSIPRHALSSITL
ncbi:hypothetical protein N657DRAFT_281341 [Parathielavia appendiculata]|uniref:Uncharacterized protein n=1 Tax=Parathielavia appendiculata TaxID=2587402 RepID=A0AAN6U3U6_9PEZI|nr:hypothetical protein N657DRAFT_281341 [Parathielavia appendiculata]